MTLIWLCRYLCFMFVVMFVAAMSTTVAPGHETFTVIMRIATAVLAVASGATAMALRRLFEKNPKRWIFESRIAIAIAMVIAILGTMLLGA